jgi:hypothetical protein
MTPTFNPTVALAIRSRRSPPPTRRHWRPGSQSGVPLHPVLSTTLLERCLWKSMNSRVAGSISATAMEDGYVVSKIVTCTPPADPRVRRTSIQTCCALRCHSIALTCCHHPLHPFGHFPPDRSLHRRAFTHCLDCLVSLSISIPHSQRPQRDAWPDAAN